MPRSTQDARPPGVTPRTPRPAGSAVWTLRPDPELVRLIRVAAGSRGQTVHAWIIAALRAGLLHQAQQDSAVRAALEP